MTWVAIPGQSAHRFPAPKSAREKALRGIKSLSQSIMAERVFGFLDHPPLALRDAYTSDHDLQLMVRLPDAWLRPGHYLSSEIRVINWTWGILWESEDWHEGWHPDRTWFGLCAEWQEKIRAAMEGKIK